MNKILSSALFAIALTVSAAAFANTEAKPTEENQATPVAETTPEAPAHSTAN